MVDDGRQCFWNRRLNTTHWSMPPSTLHRWVRLRWRTYLNVESSRGSIAVDVPVFHVGSRWSCTRWCREAAERATPPCILAVCTDDRRHGPCREQTPLSSKETDDGKGQGRGEWRDELRHGPDDSSPTAASTVYFSLDAARPTPLVEVRSQTEYERHCGSGFELFLDVTVPPLGGELVEVPTVVSQVVEQNVDVPVHGGMVRATSLFLVLPAVSRSPAPLVESIVASPALVFSPVEYLAPAPAVFRAPTPVVESFAPAPAGFQAPAPVVEFIAPAPAVSESPAPVFEYFSPAPAGFQPPAPMVEIIAPAPAVSESPAPGVEYWVSTTSANGGVYCTRLRPGQGSTVRGEAVGRSRSFQGRKVRFADSSGR